MRSSERTYLISDYPLLIALTYVCPTLICVSWFVVHYVVVLFKAVLWVSFGLKKALLMVLVMSQMLLVGSIASCVSIGLSGRDDGLGISGKVDVSQFSQLFFSQDFFTARYCHYQFLK